MSKQEELKNIVATLLNKDSEHFELLESSLALSDFFGRYSNIQTTMTHTSQEKTASHTYLESGVAISPLDAAICTNEYLRTTKYLRGMYEALKDLGDTFQDEKVHVLYAGCGPYATLIIPLLSFFNSDNLEVTFLDIHKSSLDSVRSILDALDLDKYAREYVQEDASTYKLMEETHLIVTETMKAAFDNEPQVAITLNLQPQLHNKGIFIPQRVLVGLELASTKLVQKDNLLTKIKDSVDLCSVLDLNTRKNISKEPLILNKEYTITNRYDEKFIPYLTTTIYIYKENILYENECSLTIPKKIKLQKELSYEDRLTFEYVFSSTPTIKCEID